MKLIFGIVFILNLWLLYDLLKNSKKYKKELTDRILNETLEELEKKICYSSDL